ILEEETQGVPVPRQAAVCLWHARVADSHGDALQWKLKNVVQRAERGGQRDVGLARLLRGKERQRRQLVAHHEYSAAIVFPVHAESRAVCGPLPGHIIIEMEAPADYVLYEISSDRQWDLWHGD